MSSLPVICIFGAENVKLESSRDVPRYETKDLDCRCYLTDANLVQILATDKPNIIVSFGKAEDFKNLMSAPYDVRRKWLNFTDRSDMVAIGAAVFNAVILSMLKDERPKAPPLVSVFTPTYNTGTMIYRPYKSLIEQAYGEWEWVIMDDSTEQDTWTLLQKMAEKDPRVRVYRSIQHSGVIGKLKHEACALSRGKYLVELDHDDELAPNALGDVVGAFTRHPEGKFVYTDFTEVDEDWKALSYGEGWGFGYGSYRDGVYKGHKVYVVNAANINPKTIRHIVAAPNHIRSWERDFYFSIGGHNKLIHVADDYEIMVRTFLYTRMIRMPTMCYVQFYNKRGNTNRVRNKEIQRLVRYFRNFYDRRIHDRFVELGVNDFVWDEKAGCSNLYVPNPEKEPHCTITDGVPC